MSTHVMDSGKFKSEDDILSLEASTDSFWDIGNFRRVIKRIENGARLCSDLVKMAQERIDIEAKYARGLQQWSKKWEDVISNGPEYGSLESGWKASLKEATEVADIHNAMSKVVQRDVVDAVQVWKADTFRKSIRGLKEVKRAEESFTLGQKPWVKRLEKTSRAKKTYFQSAHDLEVIQSKLRIAETSSEVSPEQCAKTRDKCERTECVFDRALEKYKSRLQDLQSYQPRYIDDLTIEFDRCQEAEHVRMEFFKKTLYKLKNALDISKNARVSAVYAQQEAELSQISPEDDLRLYALTFGTGMSHNWPEFELYASVKNFKLSSMQKNSPALRETGQSTPSTGASRMQSHHPELRSQAGSSTSSSPGLTCKSINHEAGYISGDEEWMEPPLSKEYVSGCSVSRTSPNEPQGRLMRAVYDYSGTEKEDISFKEGDIIRVVYEGENGWAEGIMADKYGYVPIGYLEPVSNN